MQIFARLIKVDEASRTVTGVIANEALDRSGEIFDYASSKPHFEKWSGDIAKATDGKSVGNVRAMHGNVAAGVVKHMDMDDLGKSISVSAHIVDDNEWKKVESGVYTGFSIGGNYARKWKGDDGLQRYEAKPCEVSLVDLPCNPDAQFCVTKADGSEEMRKFETTLDNAEALAKWAGNLTDEERAALLVKLAPLPVPVKKDYTAQAEVLAKADDAASTGNVIRALLGMETIEKGLWTVSDFACALESLASIAEGAEWEAAAEGDNSPVPAQIRAALKPIAMAFLAMAHEETMEAIGGELDETAQLALAAGGDLSKAGKRHSAKDQAAIDTMAKHHALAKKHVDAMGAQLDSLQQGAASDPADDDQAQKMAKAADSLAKLTVEHDTLTKAFAQLTTAHAELLTKAAPPKGAARAVEKTTAIGGEQTAIDTADVLNKDGSIDHLATAQKLMKAAYQAPRQ